MKKLIETIESDSCSYTIEINILENVYPNRTDAPIMTLLISSEYLGKSRLLFDFELTRQKAIDMCNSIMCMVK